MPVAASPLGIGVDNSTNRVYVANAGANSISVINGGADIRVGNSPVGVGVDPTTRLVYVANYGEKFVSVINETLNAVTANVTVGAGPQGVGVDPTNHRVYVTCKGGFVPVIDGAPPFKVIANFTIAGSSDIAVNPKTHLVYVSTNSKVFVINGTIPNLMGSPIPVASLSGGIAVNPSTNLVYVTPYSGGNVSVINGNTNNVLAPVPTGHVYLFSIGINPVTNRIYVASFGSGACTCNFVDVIDGKTNLVLTTVPVGFGGVPEFIALAQGYSGGAIAVNPTTNTVYMPNAGDGAVSVISQREKTRDACLHALTPACLVVSSTGTLFPGTTQQTSANLVVASLRTNETKTGTQMALTIFCDNNTANLNQPSCSAFYVDGNIWGPGQTDLSKSPFIIQNAEPYFYLQFHWWDPRNSSVVAWGTWWYGTSSSPNWFWGVYWWWRTYVNYYIGIPYIPWWWWSWHWMYWRYWAWWGTAFQT